ncbi:MAG: hypothetical protein ACK4UK_06255 [Flavobacterium sp.]
MKNRIAPFKKVVFIGLFLFILSCNNADDEFYNSVFIEVSNLIQVEIQPNFTVDDILWINTNDFASVLSESGQTEPLNVFLTTGAETFKFAYFIERQNGSEWEMYNLNGNLVNDLGGAVILNGITGFPIINNNNFYEYRNGIRLNQDGNYRLTFYSSFRSQGVDLISENAPDRTYMIITTTVSGITGNTYNFSVN